MAIDHDVLNSFVSVFMKGYGPTLQKANLTETELKERITPFFSQTKAGLALLMRISPDDVDDRYFDAFFREIKARVTLRYEESTTLQNEEYNPWVLDLWRQLEGTPYWDAYSKRLRNEKRWADDTVSEISKVADDILDRCGNPRDTMVSWARRGMVIGDVQSGKTALYAGLINKAADAGYKVIIVLAGLLNNLRSQTQERLEEDFVGRSTRSQRRDNRGFVPGTQVGVGKRREDVNPPVCFTTVGRDFLASYQEKGLSISSVKSCVFLVTKKNARVLKNLNSWLEQNNMPGGRKISEPLLVIDDEADCASVNTNDEDEKPTAVNREIRQLLSHFSRSSYVAFTATPYANVFIDPESTEGENDDLFPKNFITYMSIPSTYYGVHAMIDDYRREDENADPCVLMISDAVDDKEIFPLNHKKSFAKTLADPHHKLPESLTEALRQFLIINAVRDLRGEENTHRTMMVNASRFTNVQNVLTKRLSGLLMQFQNELRLCAGARDADRNSVVRGFRKCFERHFRHCGQTWTDVLKQLPKSSLGIVTRTINQSSDEVLNYSDYKQGLRVVAVGGLALSRGLTLEGLCVSYLYRTTAAYDTLMQMGRWFGYRLQYQDPCRIWMTSQTFQYFEDIATAMDDLKEEIKVMHQSERTPADFGLKVRESSGALIITSRNKMRHSQSVSVRMSFSADRLETTRLSLQDSEVNRGALVELLHSLCTSEIPAKGDAKILFEEVPKELVADFVRNFRPHESDYRLWLSRCEDRENGVANFIEGTDVPQLQKWDVVVWSRNSGDAVPLGDTGFSVIPVERRIKDIDFGRGDVVFEHARVSDAVMERVGLSKDTIRMIAERRHGFTESGRENSERHQYRRHRPKPLLVVIPVRPKLETRTLPAEEWIPAFMLSFCAFEEGIVKRGLVSYKVNKVWMKEFLDEDDCDFDDKEELN